MTNYEKITTMSLEEMAETFVDAVTCENCPFINECPVEWNNSNCYQECEEYIKTWLESEVDE